MLQKNCRIQKENGIKFYEKDILFDDYVFTNNIEISFTATYITPGLGIAIIDSTEGTSLDTNPSCYLIKIGYREAAIYYSSTAGLEMIDHISCIEAYTIQENLQFKLTKYGKKVTLYINNKKVIEKVLKSSLDKFCIGYYSNYGNIIKHINIASNVPDKWIVNMKNTKGGYIRFLDNSFELNDCINNAEVEQVNITLPPGKYYVKNKLAKINNKCDIKYYVFRSTDDRYYDTSKNLLDDNNSFEIYDETNINFKIVGTNGKISEVILSKDPDADYIPTSMDSIDFDGSYIEILSKNLIRVTWEGIVNKTPYNNIEDKLEYFLIKDSTTAFLPEQSNVLLGKKYLYEFDFKNCLFTIKDEEKTIFSNHLVNMTDRITIFKNLSAIITKLTLYNKNNEVTDVVTQDENINFVNANISSPIIVCDNYNIPLDLSSSYRLEHYENYNKYVFTNWEREYFDVKRSIKLTNKIIDKQDCIHIYGIRKNAEIDFNKFYDVKEDNINSIDLMTKDYDLIKESDLLLFDKNKSILYFKEKQLEKYELFIIDYLKKDSYAINYDYIKNVYKIDISSLEEVKILYDSLSIENSDEKIATQINKYKVTNINGNMHGYIVLTQGDE